MDRLILDFLRDLKENNNREWFQANKARYDKARGIFESFIDELIPLIREFDPVIDMITAKDCTFRIYRDVRFSGDKSPYKPNMGAYIARGGKNSALAGYYVHVEPDSSFLAGGMYMPPAETLKRIREEIYYQPEEFKRILYSEEFTRFYNGFGDEQKLKKPPKGFPADFPDIELIKYKSYAVMHLVNDHKLTNSDYLSYSIEAFKALHPLVSYFNAMLV